MPDDQLADEAPPEGATTAEGAPAPEGAPPADGDTPGDAPGTKGDEGVDLKGIFRQLTAPMIESLDSRLKEQVEVHVDEQLTAKLDVAIADRLATVDRAIADLSRTLDELRHRVAMLESRGDDLS